MRINRLLDRSLVVFFLFFLPVEVQCAVGQDRHGANDGDSKGAQPPGVGPGSRAAGWLLLGPQVKSASKGMRAWPLYSWLQDEVGQL